MEILTPTEIADFKQIYLDHETKGVFILSKYLEFMLNRQLLKDQEHEKQAVKAERAKVIAEIELHWDFTNEGHTPPQMHFIFNPYEWKQFKQGGQ